MSFILEEVKCYTYLLRNGRFQGTVHLHLFLPLLIDWSCVAFHFLLVVA